MEAHNEKLNNNNNNANDSTLTQITEADVNSSGKLGGGDHVMLTIADDSRDSFEKNEDDQKKPQAEAETIQPKTLEMKLIDNDKLLSELPFAEYASEGEYATSDVKESKKTEKKKKKGGKKKMDREAKVPKPTVNYFIGIRVPNPQIHEKLETVQSSIVQTNENLKYALTSIPKLHLTLCILHIADEEQLSKACSLMESCQMELKKMFKGTKLDLRFKGLGHFHNKVVFAKVEEGDGLKQLKSIVDVINNCFKDTPMLIKEYDNFKAHMTIAKLSKIKNLPRLRKKKIISIPANSYKAHVDEEFGHQSVDTLQLISMFEPKSSDGYYHCSKEIIFIE